MSKNLLFFALLLLGACQSEVAEPPPRLAPLLETLPTRYRPLNRQDTLTSFWAPDSLYADSLFELSNAYRSLVLLRMRFVSAAAARAAGLDTLPFRRALSRFEDYERTGYHWDFFPGSYSDPTVPETADGVPLRMSVTHSWRLALTENRRWPSNGAVYDRNSYLMDYPCAWAAEARVSDSVTYVRAYPLLADQPRPDTLYPYCQVKKPYYQVEEHRRRIPLVADRVDTTRQVLLRLSFRVLHHSLD